MAKKKPTKDGNPEGERLSFEQALERLEKIVTRLEDGQLGLDDSLTQYEQGIKYLKHCFRQLERAERKIELLAGIDEQGRAEVEPFGEADMTLEQKQAAPAAVVHATIRAEAVRVNREWTTREACFKIGTCPTGWRLPSWVGGAHLLHA